jgi:hypothetical protein
MNLTNETVETSSVLSSVYAETVEIEHHLHNREEWFGKKAVQTATDWGDPESLTPYRAISGAGVYGADANDEAQVLGTDDTPYRVGKAYFDIHRLFMVAFSVDTPYLLRIVYGVGTMADAIAAGQYSVIPVATNQTPANKSTGNPINTLMPRVAADTKIWIQAMNATNNATVDFLVGIHEYDA